MNVSALDEAFCSEVDTRLWRASSSYRARPAMSPVQRARRNHALREELAACGEIILSACRSVDAAVDFEFTSVSPAAAGLLAQPCALVGVSPLEVLDAHHRFARLCAVCAQVAARGIDALPVVTHCSLHRAASILFRVAGPLSGLRLTLPCPEAQRSQLQAIDALQALLEPVQTRRGEPRDARDRT